MCTPAAPEKMAELVFIPSAGMGHLVSIVEMAKLLAARNRDFSITILVMKLPFDSIGSAHLDSLAASLPAGRIRFLNLPYDDHSLAHLASATSTRRILSNFIEYYKPRVRDAVAELASSDSIRLAGFVIDMFCTPMIDIADEFHLPSYVFFTSGAAFLGFMLHLQCLLDGRNQDLTELKDSDAELAIPTFVNPVPTKIMPLVALDEGASKMFFDHARRFRETKGIIVNTFRELEPYAVGSILDDPKVPPVYPVGPIVNLHSSTNQNLEIIKWLDDQPPLSVVFLCFGSKGSFGEDQVREIAHGIERSSHKFLWSLRRPPPKDKIEFPTDYTNPEDVLPEGFLDRTSDMGRVIGWSPQVAVLSHPAIGGFVSHCGWNSTLESIWCGVPMASWPIYAEQQMNAFEMVRELGLAVEITLDYKKEIMQEASRIVSADDIERGIKCVMECDSEIRRKVQQKREESRKALVEGGSSYSSLGLLIDNVMNNMKSKV
ncbi:anthocyanidin 3-O-glucosyltransferase 2-like [Malania oleifera]|uniref:anthocyanidin 3-O-glucosyltransferase 2-like n=1 Tax=Malania oleifera TaxID=397392 RepID=UPI0025ADE501|nr:anthocyanidin 3-O-glucosyltransferase 2-like [Malania oleifera]